MLIIAEFVKSTEGVKAVSGFDEPLDNPQVQFQLQAENIEDELSRTDKLAQRTSSITSDDILFDDNDLGRKDTNIKDNLDQEVLLELNTEEQEQFEVLDSADGNDAKSQGVV